MKVTSVNSASAQIPFTYSHPMKTLFKKGKLPDVTHDVSGRELTIDNVTLDHAHPHSKGGKTVQGNLMLATREFNELRGNKPLMDYVTLDDVKKYAKQFEKVNEKGFYGKSYIKDLMENLFRLGFGGRR